jgi:excisionase family DNA binding protein
MRMEQWVSRQEAAQILGVTVAVVDRLIATGALPRYRLRGQWVRLRKADVEELHGIPVELLERC